MAMCFILWAALLPHKFHVSLAEMAFNPESAKLEVVLRVFSNDLERALGERLNRRLVLDREAEIDQHILAYLRTTFMLADKQGRPMTLTWVGKELQVKHTYLYLELDAPDPLEGATLRNTLFMELSRDQVNTVNLKNGEVHTSLTFKYGQTEHPLTPQ